MPRRISARALTVGTLVTGAAVATTIAASPAFALPYTAQITNGGTGLAATAPNGTATESPILTDNRSSAFVKTTGSPGSSASVDAPNVVRSNNDITTAWGGLAKITAISFNGAQSSSGINVNVSNTATSTNPWLLNAECNTASGITKGTITGITARVQQAGSSNYVDIGGVKSPNPPTGTTVAVDSTGNVASTNRTTGTVNGSYNNATKKLTITSARNLVALSSNVGSTGILVGALKPGDVLNFKGTYTLTSSQLNVSTAGGPTSC